MGNCRKVTLRPQVGSQASLILRSQDCPSLHAIEPVQSFKIATLLHYVATHNIQGQILQRIYPPLPTPG